MSQREGHDEIERESLPNAMRDVAHRAMILPGKCLDANRSCAAYANGGKETPAPPGHYRPPDWRAAVKAVERHLDNSGEKMGERRQKNVGGVLIGSWHPFSSKRYSELG
jgi:hypothetical protein